MRVRSLEHGFRPLTGTLLSKPTEVGFVLSDEVSVPSRGLSYLNENFRSEFRKTDTRFRPLTGTLLSKHVVEKQQSNMFMFPSPHGDSLI